ncbi:MAG: iron complex transport system permease protein [Pseudohongiellaceae bacterium]|jgi:iron complex transport system permease protein
MLIHASRMLIMNSSKNLIKRPIKEFIILTIALVLLIFSPLLSICFGAADISFNDVFAIIYRLFGGEAEVSAIKERIVLELRLPRIILAFLAGAGLSLSGAVLQTVTRNPLADPYLFGISSGASFGAVLVLASVGAASSMVSITGGAFLGGALSVFMVVSLAGMGVQIERMLLAGVAVQFMFSSATSLVLYLSDPQAAASLLFWILGSFTRASWDNLLIPTVIITFCLCVFLAFSRPLRAILAGDESAKALGVEVYRLRIGMLLLSSLLTATLVASCGGIGFVGLMVPHIVRRILINRSHYVLIGSAVFGGIFMIWVDVLARMLMENSELPVGIITAAMGSLFFLLVLKRRTTSS